MMKKSLFSLLSLALMLVLVLGACSQEEEKPEETLYPVTLKGVEVRVGETTVQSLLDAGLQISWVDENYQRVEVDPTAMLEADSYYTGGSVDLGDSLYANISFVTEEAAPLGQAVIARLEVRMAGVEDESLLEQMEFDGVPATEFTRDLAGERYPDWTGDENMWLHYGLTYKYDLNFDMATGRLFQFNVERSYDVDWTGED